MQTRPGKLSCPLRRRGFTLVEILVAIGCIAILASLLFGVTTRTRETAKSVKCSSNLRQIGVAAMAWSADNDGKIVAVYDGFENQKTWAYLVAPYLDANLPDYNGDTFNLASSQLILNLPVFRCPNQKKEILWPGYGYNSDNLSIYRAAGNPRRWVRSAQVQHPSRTAMITDQTQLNVNRWVPFVRPPGSQYVDAVVDFRHAGKTANVLWVDGHVSAEKASGDFVNPDGRNWRID